MSGSSEDILGQRLFSSIDFPIDKTALLERAERLNAPDAIKDAIRRLPAGALHSREELVAAVEALTES